MAFDIEQLLEKHRDQIHHHIRQEREYLEAIIENRMGELREALEAIKKKLDQQ